MLDVVGPDLIAISGARAVIEAMIAGERDLRFLTTLG